MDTFTKQWRKERDDCIFNVDVEYEKLPFFCHFVRLLVIHWIIVEERKDDKEDYLCSQNA